MAADEKTPRFFPLSQSQRNIWDLECAYPGTSMNIICTTLRIFGRLDFTLLQKSISHVLASDETLRTRLQLVDGSPFQYTVLFQEEPFFVYDFSDTSPEGIASWENATARELIPLFDGPLCRFILFRTGEQEGGLLVKTHHIISDGWSQVLICNRIADAYLKLLSGQEPDQAPVPSYSLHLQEEQEYLAGEDYSKDEHYWREVLSRSGEPSVIKSVRSAALSPVGRRKSFALPQFINHRIYSFCMANRVAPFAVFYMALAIYFRRIGGARDFTIGVPIFNRTSYRFKQSTGMFVNTLPFFNELSDDWSLNQFNEQMMDSWYELLRHQRYPFSDISRLAGEYTGNDGRLFHIALSYQDSRLYESPDASVHFDGSWHYSGYQAEQLCIHLTSLQDARHYRVDYDYLTQVFSEDEIEQLHQHLMNILLEALTHPDQPVRTLSVLSGEDHERILYTFNRNTRPLPAKDLFTSFAELAGQFPHRAALIQDGERLSYQALFRMAGDFSALISMHRPESGDLAAILLPRDFSLFAAMLGSLRAGCAYLLLPMDTPPGRLSMILRQSGACLLITSGEYTAFDQLDSLLPEDAALITPDQASTAAAKAADIDESVRTEGTDGSTSAHALAYVVYTSGSTGTPKGVEIEQASVHNLARSMADFYGTGAVLSISSTGFDAFVLESIAALLNGRTIVLPSDAALESPRQLAGLITGYGVGFLSTTPSRLNAFLKDRAFCRALGRLETIICGGEAFGSELLARLLPYTDADIYNQYGPSEATVAVSMKELHRTSHITAGAPMPNCRLYVLDAWMNPLPIGVYGQLYIGGVCVGRGYRNAPDLTQERFLPSPFETGDRLYATGDLARWTSDGEIELAGRMDDQVKLRGLRVEPRETAACFASHPAVRDAAARICTVNRQEILVLYYTLSAPVSETALLEHAASYLPRYMLPSCLIRLEKLPMTANGKLDEHALPLPEQPSGTFSDSVSPLEQEILDVFGQVLERTNLQPDSDYFLCGGNSLNAMETIALLSDRIGHTFRVSQLYALRTAGRLAASLEELPADTLPDTIQRTPRLTAAPVMERYPLSPMQQGIYVQSCLDPTGLAYHMPGVFRLPEKPDLMRLSNAFSQLIREDAILRTAFIQEDDGIFAHISSTVSFSVDTLTAASLTEAWEQFLMPFDLALAPLLRAACWVSDAGEWFLFLDVHHIIGDGMSTPLLLKRLDAGYQGLPIRRSALSYHDYAWMLHSGEDLSQADCAYWKEHLTPLPAPLLLPTDFARPHTFDFRGNQYILQLPEALSLYCDDCCRQAGISSYMLFLAAFALLLARLSGRREFLIGAPISGRLLPETYDICGPFINTLPLRMTPDPELLLSGYLQDVRREVTDMLDHPKASLEQIVSALGLARTLSQSPLYQVMFSERPLDSGSFTFDRKPLTHVPMHSGTVKMDMTVETFRENGIHAFAFDYATSLFLPETIAYYGRCLVTLLEEFVSGEDRPLRELCALSAADRMELIDGPSYLVTPFFNLPIHRMIEQETLLHPDAPAIFSHGQMMTRRTLETRACELANLLTDSGAQKGDCICLAFSRCTDLFAAMLAVLKTGCAYMPVLASYPRQRLCYMLGTANARLLLCDSKAREQLPDALPCPVVEAVRHKNSHFKTVPVKDTDLVNVMFTSGSTGKPKGVMLKHRSVSNLYVSIRELLNHAPGPILCTTNVVFDSFIGESLFPLAMGKPIVLADEEEMMLPWKLASLIEEQQVDIFQVTPARLQMCLGNDAFCQAAAGLKLVLLGGEVLTPQLLNRLHEVTSAVSINMYGPTEATVYMTMIEVVPDKHITIGRPLKNSRIYVLDEQHRPVLPTACGELCLAGECLAAGYISRPDLTEKAFVPDPFFPGELMYLSGDIGRLRLDGSYDFYGRRDSQVKLNGQRVELDEINGAVTDSGFARLAATVPVRRDDGSMELCTFYQPSRQTGSDDDIRASIRRVLPAYMIPSRLLALDSLPLTPSSKIDLQALKRLAETMEEGEPEKTPEPEKTSVPEDASVPKDASVPVTSAVLLDIWERVLKRTGLSEDRSFFEQGGTSLAALSVLSHYFNMHLELSLAQFYEHPTIQEQLVLLGQGTAGSAAGQHMAEPAIPHTAPAVPLPSKAPSEAEDPAAPHAVLLTGATGFLGAHLLYALLEHGTKTVICTMRDGSRSRLFDTLSWYFGAGWLLRFAPSIEVRQADLTLPKLGLSDADYRTLADRVGTVYHAAADVRHYAADTEAFLAVNVNGTRAMTALALEAGASFHHISTCSVSGERFLDGRTSGVFTEQDFDIGQDWQANLYVKSKFLAETAVMDAREKGLDARIYRIGRLVGRSRDGLFQRNPQTNAFFLLMRGVCAVGAIPASFKDTPSDLTPVDYCADAILALAASDGPVFHIVHPQPPTMETITRSLCPSLSLVSDETFMSLLLQASMDERREQIAPLVDYWQHVHTTPPCITISCGQTLKALQAAGFAEVIAPPARLLGSFPFLDGWNPKEKEDSHVF